MEHWPHRGDGGTVRADPDSQGLAAAVHRTGGARPWRHVFHAANGVVVAVALQLTGAPRNLTVAVLGTVLVALATVDFVRLRSRRANILFFTAFRPLASPREAAGIASSTWYVLGLLLTVAIFSRTEAISAILVLALADPVAGWWGRRWGRHPFLGGSLEGSAAFLLVALAVLMPRYPWPMALGAAVVTTLAERRAWPLDDNLVIPVTCATLLTFLSMVW